MLNASVPKSAKDDRRNGETTPPTTAGKYDFFGKRYGKHLGPKNIEVEIAKEFGVLSVLEAYPVGIDFYQGRWWGPK